MKSQTVSQWKATWVAAALLLLVGPAAAFAQCPVPLAQPAVSAPGSILGILRETRERLKVNMNDPSPLNQGTFVDGYRVANATEVGTLVAGCGTLEGFSGTITVQATSKIPMNVGADGANLGIGPIQGTFNVDSTLGRINGQLSGILDFVPTNSSVQLCGGPCPFVTTAGTWKSNGKKRGIDIDKVGSFAGVALVPFQHPANGAWLYLDPTGVLTGTQNAFVPLTAQDFNADGLPEAKFIITLFD
jgi:hypothetical protein